MFGTLIGSLSGNVFPEQSQQFCQSRNGGTVIGDAPPVDHNLHLCDSNSPTNFHQSLMWSCCFIIGILSQLAHICHGRSESKEEQTMF